MDAISRYERRVYGSLAVLLVLAAASSPLWGFGRPDRVWGLVLGIAAGALRLWWTFFLARRFGNTTRSRYATLRLLGFVPLAAALAAAGFAERIDLYAAAFGILFPAGASIVGSVLELRAVERQDRAALTASDARAEEAPRHRRT